MAEVIHKGSNVSIPRFSEYVNPIEQFRGLRNDRADRANQLEQQELAKADRLNAIARQEAADTRANEQLQWKRDDRAKAEEQILLDEALGKRLMNVKDTKETTTTIPGITPEAVEGARKDLIFKAQEDAGIKYRDELDRLMNEQPAEVPSGPVSAAAIRRNNRANPGTATNVLPEVASERTLPLGTAGRKAQRSKTTPTASTVVPETAAPIVSPTGLTLDQMHAKALEKSGLSENMQWDDFNIDESSLPKVTAASKKTTTTPLEKEEWVNNAIKSTNVEGTTGTQYIANLDKINKLADAKFGKDVSASNLLKMKELELKNKEFNEKKASGYWKKKGATGSGFNLAEKLYTEVGATGESDDLKAVENYLDKNKGTIDNMTKADKQELYAKLKATYGNEGDWFTWTGWDDLK